MSISEKRWRQKPEMLPWPICKALLRRSLTGAPVQPLTLTGVSAGFVTHWSRMSVAACLHIELQSIYTSVFSLWNTFSRHIWVKLFYALNIYINVFILSIYVHLKVVKSENAKPKNTCLIPPSMLVKTSKFTTKKQQQQKKKPGHGCSILNNNAWFCRFG